MIFIRPWALVLILAWPLLLLARRRVQPDNPWKKVIDPAFLPYLMQRTEGRTGRRNAWFIGVLWAALCVAAAGPAFEKIPVHSVVRAPDTVIVADLSPAVQGPVLAQLRVKLYELLTALKGDNVGLVLYDTKGYIVSPLTPDTAILRDMVPALAPDVLPEVATYPVQGFEKAAELLGADNPNGRILFVTAGGFDAKPVAQLAKYLPYKIGVLGIGDAVTGVPMALPNGGFVRDAGGQPILARADEERLSTIGTYAFARADGGEIADLLAATRPETNGAFDGNETALKADVWRDLGIYFVVACLPFAALLFRKGVFFVLLLLWGTGASAAWFERPDQTAYRQDVAGVEAYRAGDYEKAVDLWQNSPYNLGNALAYQGQYQQAIDAYAQELTYHPDNADAAFNKKYLEDQLKQNQQSDEQGESSNDTSDKTEQSSGGQGQSSDTPSESETSPDRQSDTTGETGETEPPTAPEPQTPDTETAGEPQGGAVDDTSPDGKQETQQLFNALKKDPSRVLRYRIYRQHQKYQ